MPPDKEPRSDDEVRAEDASRVGDNAVERRAVGGGIPVRNRRAQPDTTLDRAESRGVYRDLDGRRRIVGAGQAIPDGWERVEKASVEDRGRKVPTVQEDGEETEGGGGRSRSRSRSRS